MKIFLAVILLATTITAAGQKIGKNKAKLTEKSIVKDSSGVEFPFFLWQPMLASGEYTVIPVDSLDKDSEFRIYNVSDPEEAKFLLASGKPPESPFFKNGSDFTPLKAKDVNGNPINTKGKITVINYWFINCPPCQREMPKLNELVKEYRNDSSVVFLAIALDKGSKIQSFLKETPFFYTAIGDGRYLANEHRITSFPTHVVINKEGKIVFNCAGYTNSIGFWLKKSIDECK